MDAEGRNGIVTTGKGGGTVSLMGICIDHPGGLNQAFGLQFADGDYDVIDNAEAVSVGILSMMHTAAESKTKRFVQSHPAGLNGSGDDGKNTVK